MSDEQCNSMPFCNAIIFRILSRASSSFIFVTRKNLFRYWSSRRFSNIALYHSEVFILSLRLEIFFVMSSGSLSSAIAFRRSDLSGFSMALKVVLSARALKI